MTTLRIEQDYRIDFNGSNTYFVIVSYNNENTDDCIFTTNTERKANNFLNRTLKDHGII